MESERLTRINSDLKFTGIPNEIIEQFTDKIGVDGIGFYVVLKKFADYSSGECYPKMGTLAALTGMSIRSVQRKLDVLVKFGLLAKESGQEKGSANVYTFTLSLQGGKTNLSRGYDNSVLPGKTPVSSLIKEELEPLNDNQEPLSSPPVPTGELVLNSDETAPTHPKRKQASPSDPRHAPFREKLEKFWVYLNPDVESFAWGAGEAGQLAEFLRKWPKLTLKDFHFWLVNYSESEDITPSKTPKQFLPFLHEYANGPRNEFHRPKDDRAHA